MKNKNIKESTKIDKAIYWLVQLTFAVLAAAGIWNYLQPVDPILSLPITVLFIGMMFYISIKNR